MPPWGGGGGSQVLHRPLVQSNLEMCQMFLGARNIYLRASGAIQGQYGLLACLCFYLSWNFYIVL